MEPEFTESSLKLMSQLKENIRKVNPSLNMEKIEAAFWFANAAHAKQLRKEGSPYITHPVAVAEIIAELGLDEDSIAAALLHDCIEDTTVTFEDISKNFGTDVAEMVEGVTKLTRYTYVSKEEEQMENLRKMLMAMAKDIRVILIKVSDRLHNMRTMSYLTEEKQRSKSLETMEIYAPIAHRLGMQRMKWELEDLSLKYLDPIGFKNITDELSQRKEINTPFLDGVKERIHGRLEENGIKAAISSRIKHVYSIYRKMYNQNKVLDEVYDLYAIRVVVDSIADCYNTLGYVHDMFKMVPGRFKDYINTPKPNMYQSLHTTVIGREGIPFEVQIRTWDMHHTAEYGIAAHWKYKQGLSGQLGTEEKLEWVRRLLESQQDSDAEDFIRSLKIDMFDDEVFVFSPKGDVINMPAGSTPIDFAYSIHSAVGNRMMGAKVNGRIVTFDHALQNGDIVEIITSNSSHGPSRDWMQIAKSNQARQKIKQWFKKERREENITQGKSAFIAELRHNAISLADVTSEEVLPLILKKVSFGSLDEMYAAIGYGGITAIKTVNRIKDELLRINRIHKAEAQTPEQLIASQKAQPPKKKKAEKGIIVEDLSNCLVKFSRCCSPVPGDEIVGFITRGYGVSIHRKDCINAAEADMTSGRWVKVTWADIENDTYQALLELSCKDRDKLLMDVVTVLSANKVKMSTVDAKVLNDGYCVINLGLEVRDLSELETIRTKINRVSGVIEVRRSVG